MSVSWEICIGSALADGTMESLAFRLGKISWIVESNHPSLSINDVPAWPLHLCQIPPEVVDGEMLSSVPWPQSCRAAQSSGCPAMHVVSSTRVSKGGFYIPGNSDPYYKVLSGSLPCMTAWKWLLFFGKCSASRCESLAFLRTFLLPLVCLIRFFVLKQKQQICFESPIIYDLKITQ